MSRRRGEGRKRIAALEAEVATHRLLIDRLTADPEKVAGTLTEALVRARDRAFTTVPPDDDADDWGEGLICTLAGAITGPGKAPVTGASDGADIPPDGPPSREFTKAEEAAWAEIIREFAEGQS